VVDKKHSLSAGSPRAGRVQVDVGRLGAVTLAGLAVATLLLALYGPDGSLSLLAQPFIAAAIGLAAAGVLIGVAGRPRSWWLTWGLGIGLAAAVVVAGLWWWVGASGLVTQHYPPSFLAWVWAGLVAFGIGVTGWWTGPAVIRVVRFITVPVTLFASFLLINLHYGYWPTMGDLLDRPLAGQVSAPGGLASILNRRDPSRIGRYGPISIPSPAGFDGGPAWAWIPPAYTRADRADLSVLLMLPGWPGDAANWARAGEGLRLANGWAKAHGGIAPVMVFVSGNGAADHDTECVNGTQGPAETYLTHQVPRFITHVLGIDRDPARWGVVGFSEGGTCAIELAAGHPTLYGRFVDISGELVPSFGPDGGAAITLKGLFAGNAEAQLHHEPMWLMAHHTYPNTVGWFSAGDGDRYHERISAKLTKAARAAGITAYNQSGGSGGHSWSYARETLDDVYPALVASMPTPKIRSPSRQPPGRIVASSPSPSPRRHHRRRHGSDRRPSPRRLLPALF
jgi:S-formylglutathione hydrolase FrmB